MSKKRAYKIPPLFLNRIFNKAGPPIHLIWFITGKCNLRCSHCFYYSQLCSNAGELSLEEISKTISNLSPLLSVSLTGGEPFLRSDLTEIVKLFYKRNLTKNILLFSNGFDSDNILATTGKILSNCSNINIFLGVSIDGYEEEHDRYRNKKGSYQNAINTITRLKNLKNDFSNLNVGVVITFHRGNQNIIKGLIEDIYSKFGIIPGLTLIRGDPKSPELKNIDANIYKDAIEDIEYLKASSRDKSLFQTIIATREALGWKLIHKTFIARSRSYNCYAGSLLGIIYENGDLYPCEMLKDSNLGNLRNYDYDINKIWNSERANEVRKLIKTRKCFCTYECQHTCNTLYNIRFSPYFVWNILKDFVNPKRRYLCNQK